VGLYVDTIFLGVVLNFKLVCCNTVCHLHMITGHRVSCVLFVADTSSYLVEEQLVASVWKCVIHLYINVYILDNRI